MKLQDAYASENNTVGNWVSIGFIAPGAKAASENTGSTTSFTYSGGAAAVAVVCPTGANNENGVCKNGEATVPASGGTVTGGFVATSLAKLNDCPTGTAWQVDATTENGVVAYTKTIGGQTPSENTNCNALTPQFANIGK